MSKTIFRGTGWTEDDKHEAIVMDNGTHVLIEISTSPGRGECAGRSLGIVILDLHMAGTLADHLRDRVDDLKQELEAQS